MTQFTIDDLIHTGPLYDGVNQFDWDVPFYTKWLKEKGGDVLELCCGTGRLTIPLAQAGISMHGLDGSSSMLERAKEKISAASLNIPLYEGDMRSFSLNKKFSSIFIPFNSLQCLYPLDDVLATFAQVKEHLLPGGQFIFDVFNPSIDFMVDRAKVYREVTTFTNEKGQKVRISERCKYDSAGQVNRVTWRHDIDGVVREAKLDMRCFYPLELEAIIRLSGFEVVAVFGDFDEGVFGSDSLKIIYVLE